MTHTDRPVIRLRPNKSATRVRRGFPWAYDNELVLDRRARKIPPGDLVKLAAADGELLGTAALHPGSKIAARVLDRDPDASIDQGWLQQRLQRALSIRDRLYAAPFYRLVHAEADGLPGLVIDRFGDCLVIQPNAAWIDVRRDMLVAALDDLLAPQTIYVNAQGRARVPEGLDDQSGFAKGDLNTPIAVKMNGATYLADIAGGQKTGLFFDQRENQAFAARLAQDARVLDVCSHVGGFGLAALAGGAHSVTCVDASQPALDLAAQGAARMGCQDKLSCRKGDAFDVMSELQQMNEAFDLVVCDPPAFAPQKSSLSAGLRAYERMARRGASLVTEGGYLVLCSCSHAADLEKFRTACAAGIGKSGRSAQILHTGAAGPDHPIHPQLSESGYLKALFYRLD